MNNKTTGERVFALVVGFALMFAFFSIGKYQSRKEIEEGVKREDSFQEYTSQAHRHLDDKMIDLHRQQDSQLRQLQWAVAELRKQIPLKAKKEMP